MQGSKDVQSGPDFRVLMPAFGDTRYCDLYDEYCYEMKGAWLGCAAIDPTAKPCPFLEFAPSELHEGGDVFDVVD